MNSSSSRPPLAIFSRAPASIALRSWGTISRMKPILFMARRKFSPMCSIGTFRRISRALGVSASSTRGSRSATPSTRSGCSVPKRIAICAPRLWPTTIARSSPAAPRIAMMSSHQSSSLTRCQSALAACPLRSSRMKFQSSRSGVVSRNSSQRLPLLATPCRSRIVPLARTRAGISDQLKRAPARGVWCRTSPSRRRYASVLRSFSIEDLRAIGETKEKQREENRLRLSTAL